MAPDVLISIVDDDAQFQRALERLIRSFGYETSVFSSAEEFIGSGARHTASCLITDMQMEGMSGIDLTRWLSTNEPSMPVIMITARDDDEIETDARASGVMHFFRKPIDANDLANAIESVLGPGR